MGSYKQTPAVVLVVEDEPLIRLAAMDFVEEAGFTAMEAANAAQALAVLETYRHISILFTDIDMPGSMNGLALAREVGERWPHIHIFISSGHRDIAERDCPEGARFFPKPHNESQISGAMWDRVSTAAAAE